MERSSDECCFGRFRTLSAFVPFHHSNTPLLLTPISSQVYKDPVPFAHQITMQKRKSNETNFSYKSASIIDTLWLDVRVVRGGHDPDCLQLDQSSCAFGFAGRKTRAVCQVWSLISGGLYSGWQHGGASDGFR